tara:strand:- start:1509 stop:1790 length:282 start_codon:yes stop_codon:yes gene_type:complete
MAVGDVVNGTIGSANVWGYFQPASSVECIITSCFTGDYSSYIALGTSGTKAYTDMGSSTGRNPMMVKICINNTKYLGCKGNINPSGYSGIQIK